MGCGSSAPVTLQTSDMSQFDNNAARKTADQNARPVYIIEDNNNNAKQIAPNKLQVAYLSEVGFSPFSRKVNQDSLVISTSLLDVPGLDLFGVFDGHGEFGHHVSRFIAEKLPLFLESEGANLINNSEKSIEQAVTRVCEALKSSNIRTSYSGTTATFVVRFKDSLYVANIGDSRAVLARRVRGDSGKFEAIDLSTDHKPDLPKERERILSRGGRVETLRGPPGTDCGPYRVWLSQVDVPGLAMSRSIGDDVAHSVGVINHPDIVSYRLERSDDEVFLVLATDGVWEFISSQEAVDVLGNSIGKDEAALQSGVDNLVRLSQKLWRQHEQVVDDTTAILISLSSSDQNLDSNNSANSNAITEA
jgi:serine/threonine protein phosphatase PrpC